MTAGIERAACIGGGVIGGGWAGRFALNGIDVAIYDPDPGAERKARAMLDNAERAFARLFGDDRPAPGALRFAGSIADAVDGADFVQESVPERLDLKRAVLAEIDAAAAPGAVIASSTSGLLPSDMQSGLKHPGRLLVGHPFNPVYLLPLVEIVAGRETDPASVERAADIYASVGMKPVVVRKEIDAFIGDRLQEALWREALWLVHDGVATVEEIDDVMRYSFGLRWAQMGVFQTYRLAGGEAGMRHFLEQFGPSLAWPWSKLTDVPDLDDALIDAIAGQSDEQAAGRSIRELERIRDDNLVAILEALERSGETGWGAGAALKEARRRLRRKRDAAGFRQVRG
ncbi:MAG: L-carnitine dehydrogenase [Rhodospirillaceae bacterium]|nr:L-carnitine dehydrogenase [Rhodospirillaceae bacterium]MYB15275.1 L-carnitine dehydrogenase [Rhodospirillaceae bacterium]MYI50714.1 L-carnitine dehydrogenase [Rhodospirillaceae bacterium]